MPIQRSSQEWTPGATVKIGFMALRVVQLAPTPGDHAPDAYVLQSANGTFYRFVPHHGITKRRSLVDALIA